MERLQKVIANAGVASRRKAEQMIIDGRVTVNENVVTELGVKVSSNDKIKVDGVPLEKEEKLYYLFYKPRSCISAVSDDKDRKVVTDFFKEKGINSRIYPIGRLDYDTTGVLLLTNDGDFANDMMHPKGEIPKTYLARIKGLINGYALGKLKSGVNIDGHHTAKAKVKLISKNKENNSSQVRITIHEGKYHQVKKMFEAVGHPVKKLSRISYGFLTTEGLQSGTFRELSTHEVKMLRDMANKRIDTKNIRRF